MAGRLRRPGQLTGELSWPGAGHGPERDEEAGGRAPWRPSCRIPSYLGCSRGGSSCRELS
jgi:hypothetical protein